MKEKLFIKPLVTSMLGNNPFLEIIIMTPSSCGKNVMQLTHRGCMVNTALHEVTHVVTINNTVMY